MRIQPFELNGQVFYLWLEWEEEGLKNLNLGVTNSVDFYHFNIDSTDTFLSMNKLQNPLDKKEILQVRNALQFMRATFKFNIQNDLGVTVSDGFQQLSLKCQEYLLLFPLDICTDDISIRVLQKINFYQVELIKLQAGLLNDFIYEHDEKRSSISKLISKMNTRNDIDPFDNFIVKETLDIAGSHHIDHARITSNDIVDKFIREKTTTTKYATNATNGLFNDMNSKLWAMVATSEEANGTNAADQPQVLPSDSLKQPCIPISSLKS